MLADTFCCGQELLNLFSCVSRRFRLKLTEYSCVFFCLRKYLTKRVIAGNVGMLSCTLKLTLHIGDHIVIDSSLCDEAFCLL